ncbi:LOW QUALITY PROTEIN: DDE_4 domain-containing protein, partial [Cephalotus follicularis]
DKYIKEMLNGPPQACYEILRIQPSTFSYFCEVLRKGALRTNNIMVEEQVEMFLYIVGKHFDQRSICDHFQHSLETVNRHCRRVMRAVAKIGKHLIYPSNDDDLPPHIKFNEKYYPWFKDCVGAIDGTHVSTWIPAEKIVSFKGRKSTVTQNVLCACNFNMEFTFVYSGWEGTANDSRVFLDAVTRPEVNFPWLIQGPLVYDGVLGGNCLWIPYMDLQHTIVYDGMLSNPTGYKELFNYRHSSIRNVIERYFGLLKARFPILKLMPCYKPVKQHIMVVACCVVYNFICR